MVDVIRAKAEAVVAAQKFLQDSAPQVLPVDVLGLAREKNINVIREDNLPDEISGFFKRYGKDGRPVIVLNNAHAETRKRFTLAHELGHFVLHKDPLDVYTEKIHFRMNAGATSDTNEIAANAFAAELLMPASFISAELNKKFPDGFSMSQIDDVVTSDLAAKFNVSREAMGRRIQALVL